MIALSIGKEFRIPVKNADRLENKFLQKLTRMGMKFVVTDIDVYVNCGSFNPKFDMITISTCIDSHGEWLFERHELDSLIFNQ